ncbi:MAG: hypothetical protein EPO07_16910, partial [Verrucomicrobia bacterium]
MNIQHSTFNAEPSSKLQTQALEVECSMLNVECSQPFRWFFAAPLLALLSFAANAADTNAPAKLDRYISYTNVVLEDVPWSVHVVKLDRARADLRFYATLGGGENMGSDIVTEQIKSVPREVGQPLAAINGDFYEKAKDYPTRPRDVQIRRGEVLTQPAGHSSFWIDANGQPQLTNIASRFRVVWPTGRATPFVMNTERADDAAVLFTSVIGKSTQTKGGVEYVLEKAVDGNFPPLRAGVTNVARIRAIQTAGNTLIERDTAVLSLGPTLAASAPALKPGDTLQLVTETFPDLAGVDFAIGGGPALVKDGKVMTWKGWVHVRHPRTAIGWSKTHFYLVEVDGRQLDLSVGMTFA